MKLRSEIINEIILKYEFKTYLEIGVCVPAHNFDLINVNLKHSVDPEPKGSCTYRMTSDDFFKNHVGNQKYDMIFIDGMHTAAQVYKDVINSINCLNDGGFIMLHDCNPPTKFHARTFEEYQKIGGEWNGDVYLGFIRLRSELKDSWCSLVINEDWGCGILTKRLPYFGMSISCDVNKLTWEEFEIDNDQLLNLISYEDFNKLINNN